MLSRMISLLVTTIFTFLNTSCAIGAENSCSINDVFRKEISVINSKPSEVVNVDFINTYIALPPRYEDKNNKNSDGGRIIVGSLLPYKNETYLGCSINQFIEGIVTIDNVKNCDVCQNEKALTNSDVKVVHRSVLNGVSTYLFEYSGHDGASIFSLLRFDCEVYISIIDDNSNWLKAIANESAPTQN